MIFSCLSLLFSFHCFVSYTLFSFCLFCFAFAAGHWFRSMFNTSSDAGKDALSWLFIFSSWLDSSVLDLKLQDDPDPCQRREIYFVHKYHENVQWVQNSLCLWLKTGSVLDAENSWTYQIAPEPDPQHCW